MTRHGVLSALRQFNGIFTIKLHIVDFGSVLELFSTSSIWVEKLCTERH